MLPVLVCQGCHKHGQRDEWLTHYTLTSHSSRGWKCTTEAHHPWASDGGSLPGSQTGASSRGPHIAFPLRTQAPSFSVVLLL
jgi:hypothetical protein